MENASKALLMAGGVLVAMLIISMAVILFNTYGELGVTYEEKMSEAEIQKLNSNFTKFEGRQDITIQEIVTIVNFAKQYKEQTEIDIKVFIVNDELKDNNIITLIENNSTVEEAGTKKVKYFECNVSRSTDIGYDSYGKVTSITFQNT